MGDTEVRVEEVWPLLEERVYKPIGFDPLPKQKPLLCSEYRNNIFVGGVGAGKSLTAAMFAFPRVQSVPLKGAGEIPQYWLVGETLDIPRIEFGYLYDALAEYGLPVKDASTPTEGKHVLKIPGLCQIETRSWTNWDSLHGRPCQGILVCEAGLLNARVWHERLRGRLARVPGSWVLMCGTLEDSGQFFKDLVRSVVVENNKPNWFGVSMATWENTHVYPGGMEDPEIQLLRESTPPDIFMERYGAIPKAVAALVYREFTHTYHVGRYKFDRNRPVWIWIDPAGGYALNAVQRHGQHTYIIDEVHIEPGNTERVIEEAVGRPWWGNVEYGVIDATQTDPRAVWTQGYIWPTIEAKPVPLRYKKVPVEAGIELVRTQLHSGIYDRGKVAAEDIWDFQGRRGVALLHVDAGCTHTIEEFTQGYKRKQLASGEYSDKDVVKKNDHHMDCIRYGLADMLGFSVSARPSARKVREWIDSRPISV